MKIYSALKIVLVISLILFTIGCSASTSDRYKSNSEKTSEKTNSKEIAFIEDFDFTKYRPPFSLPKSKEPIIKTNVNIWFEFGNETKNSSIDKTITGTSEGFRVQVLSTDDLDEANQMRSKIYFSTDQKDVYIIFDPPFYKVQVGDFTNSSDADKLGFKLTQIGYSEARVVKEAINLFK